MYQENLNIILVEDEPKALKMLQKMLEQYVPNCTVLATAKNLAQAIEVCQQNLDLIFLDLNLPDGNGFDLLKAMPHDAKKIILTTAEDEHGIKALKLGIKDYLVKPYTIEDIQEAILNYRKDYQAEKKGDALVLKDGKLCVPDTNGMQFISTDDIVRVESDKNYSTIILSEQKEILVSKTLKLFANVLTSNGFLRLHQSHLVNTNFIKRLNNADGGFVELKNGDKIPVSASGKISLKEYFGL